MTLLTFAAHHGASKAVQALLENGAKCQCFRQGGLYSADDVAAFYDYNSAKISIVIKKRSGN